MNVKQILDRVIDLSVGINDVDEEQRASFLNYLNMCCEQLYFITAPLNDKLKLIQINNIDNENDAIVIKDEEGEVINVLKITEVINNVKYKFEENSFSDFQKKKFLQENSSPIFCLKDNEVFLYSNIIKPYDVFISYIPEFVQLEDNEVDKIPFEKGLHYKLVYGTLYYAYQEMDGFKSSIKESIAANEWNKTIQECGMLFFNSSNDDFVPYTRV